MEIKEYSTSDGDYIVEIKCSMKKGDMARMFERNKDHRDVPLCVIYNMGVDMPMLTEEGQKARVMSMLKMVFVANTDVVGAIGGMIGAKLPKVIRPHELG